MAKIVHDNRTGAKHVENRERAWCAVMGRGAGVLLRNCLVLKVGEQIDDQPPEVRLTDEQWRERHAEFGLDIDGQPL
jgi:hypothetical protein